MFYVYIIHTEKFDKYYKGFSLDPYARLDSHNSGGSRYTSNFVPWKLVHIEIFNSKIEALKREKVLKKYSKNQIMSLASSPKNKLKT